MLREFDLQRMHWADKTQSMLHQRQMEACETRLLSYPTESIFTLQDERETECWWQCSYDAEESPKSPVLHTLREMRANVLARLPVEAALLTETEHALIVRLILCEGQARIDGWQELSAAESLLRRLWCTLEVDEQDVLLHLPRELMIPLSLILREQRHQELRSRLLFFDTDTKAALYLSGMLSAKQALSRLYESVLRQQVVIHLGCQSGEKFRFFDAARPCRQHRYLFAAVEHAVACAAPAYAAPQQLFFARQQLWTRRAHRQHNCTAFDDVVADQCHVAVAVWHNLPRQLLDDDDAHVRRLCPEA